MRPTATLDGAPTAETDRGVGPTDAGQMLDIRMIASADVVLESQDDTHVVVANIARGTRLRVSRSVYRFLQAFRQPRRVGDVLSTDDTLRAMPQVRLLIEKHLLDDVDSPVPATRQTRVRNAVAYRFCNAPALVATHPPDFVILGIPCDLFADTDGRLAPDLIRRKSMDYPYQLRFADARPRGWFDADRAAWILRGATIADAGDVHIDHGEPEARLHERVAFALAQSCGGRSIPVLLGGDRSATYAAVAAMPHRRDLVVIQLTADPAGATAEGAGDRLCRIDHVAEVVTLGGHGDAGKEAGRDRLVYLSVDLALVAPPCGPGGIPAPALQDLKTLIGAIGAAHAIVGIDLVGLDMRRGRANVGAIIGCQLALTAMDAAHDQGPA